MTVPTVTTHFVTAISASATLGQIIGTSGWPICPEISRCNHRRFYLPILRNKHEDRSNRRRRTPPANQLLAIEQPPPPETNGNFIRISCLSKEKLGPNLFLLDTGASTHVRNASLLSNYVSCDEDRSFFTVQGSTEIKIRGRGDIIIRCATRNFIIFLKLNNVLFAPDIPVNVISVSQLCADNCISIVFANSAAIFYRSELIDPVIPDFETSFTRKSLPRQDKSESDVVLPNTAKLLTDPIFTLNFSQPFFYVPRTKDNLYSFTLSSFVCSFKNIMSQSSPMYVFNKDIPQGACQAVLLQNTELITDAEQSTSATSSMTNKLPHTQCNHPIADRCYLVYQTRAGKPKQNLASIPCPTSKKLSRENVLEMWHRRMAHVAFPVVREVLKIYEPNFKYPPDFRVPFCDVCVRAKLTTKSFDKIRTLPTRPAEIIAADLIGPVTPQTSPHGYRFVLTVIDVFSKFARIFLLKSKAETVGHLQNVLSYGKGPTSEPWPDEIF